MAFSCSGNFCRNSRGSTLFLVVCVAFMIIAVAMIFVCLYMVMNQQRRNESKAEELALTMSTAINRNDWIGDINSMTGYSRELVFSSRQALNTVMNSYPQLKPLATQLLDESRSSALIVGLDKKSLIAHIAKTVEKDIQSANAKSVKQRGLTLPWVSTGVAKVRNVSIGFIDGVSSNVRAPLAIPELKENDISQKYLEEKTLLYNANINARLPAPDDDINFTICSLPAMVKDTVSPARLASNEEFRQFVTIEPGQRVDLSKCEQLPSAVQVKCVMSMSSSTANKKVAGEVMVAATAASPGATQKLETR